MHIRLNGRPHEIPNRTSVHSLIAVLGLDIERVAVEVNRRILKRAEFVSVRLADGDEVEVVTFVGGG